MNNSVILQEAFKQLKLLEATDFPLDPEGMEGAREFLDDDPSLDELSIVDMDANSEEELEEATHVGDVILECKVCHSRIFLDPEEVVLSDDKLWANEDLECPYCYCTRGYKIIGQVAPYEAEPTVEIEPKEEPEEVEEEEVVEESLKESIENLDIETEHDIIHVNSEDKPEEGEETMLPVDDSLKDEILSDEEEKPEEPLEEEPEEPLEDEFEDIDIEDFDEESFDNMGESYLRKVYDNVESFKTTRVVENGNGWIVEGVINFKSGKSKNTEFIFEAATLSKGNTLTFKGGNPQITRGNKAFAIRGKVDNKKFITESFRYNYKQKDTNGKSVRVYGTIKK